MARIAGITIERTATGKPVGAYIDFRKQPQLIMVLQQNGIEIEDDVKLSSKMKRSMKETASGLFYERSLTDILDV
jgi:hypothetical protein